MTDIFFSLPVYYTQTLVRTHLKHSIAHSIATAAASRTTLYSGHVTISCYDRRRLRLGLAALLLCLATMARTDCQILPAHRFDAQLHVATVNVEGLVAAVGVLDGAAFVALTTYDARIGAHDEYKLSAR